MDREDIRKNLIPHYALRLGYLREVLYERQIRRILGLMLTLRQTAKLLPSVFSSLNSSVKIFVVNSRRHFSIFT